MLLVWLTLFIVLTIVLFFLPGRAVLYFFQIPLAKRDEFILSWCIGLACFIIVSYIFAWLQAPYLVLLTFFAIDFVFLYRLLRFKQLPLLYSYRLNPLVLITVVTGALIHLSITFFSGWYGNRGLQFIGVNAIDGLTHLSYIHALMNSFPPKNLAFAGVELRGYHYFYDFLLSRFTLFFNFPLYDLYFRMFPFFLSCLFGSVFYVWARLFTHKRVVACFVLIFVFTLQSFTPLFTYHYALFYSGLFYGVGLLLNPPLVLSLIFLLSGLFFLPKILEKRGYVILTALFLGLLSQIKVYAGFIGILALVVYCLVLFFKRRSLSTSIVTFITCVLTALLTYFTFVINNSGTVTLVWAPLVFYDHFMRQWFFHEWNWEQRRVIFLEHSNIPRLIILYAEALSVFWIINLGTKLVMLKDIRNMFSLSFWRNPYVLILVVCFLVPLIMISFFIQSVSIFDITQFMWIGMILLSIPAGISLGNLFVARGYIVKTICLLLVGLLAGVEIYLHLKGYVFEPTGIFLSKDQESVLMTLKKTVSETQYVTVLPRYDEVTKDLDWGQRGLIGPIAGRTAYLETISTVFDFGKEHDVRKQNLRDLRASLLNCDTSKVSEVMNRIGTQYLLAFESYTCLQSGNMAAPVKTAQGLYFYRF